MPVGMEICLLAGRWSPSNADKQSAHCYNWGYQNSKSKCKNIIFKYMLGSGKEKQNRL